MSTDLAGFILEMGNDSWGVYLRWSAISGNLLCPQNKGGDVAALSFLSVEAFSP